MEGGYVLSFSDRTFGQFFKDEFGIDVYGEKNGYDYLGTSKANRMRAVWAKEDDKTVGSMIVTLVEYAKTDLLTDGKEINITEKELLEKAGVIGMNLLLSEFSANFRPEVQALKNKAQIIKDFNACGFQSKTTNEKIYILKVMYSYYQGILEAYYGSGLFFLTAGIDNLNDYFKILRKRTIEIIHSDKTFSEIKDSNAYGQIFESITSLYASAEFLDVTWDDIILPSLINLREEIANKDLFENNSEIHTADTAVSSFFQVIDKEIDTLKKYLLQRAKAFNKQELPKYKEQFNGAFKSDKEQTIKHEVTHLFKNSIQETDIVLHHKYENTDPNKLYITKKNDDFYYKGRYLDVSKTAEYYQVFCALFAKLPDGGEIFYKELGEEIQSRIPKAKSKNEEEMRKFIQSNLTDTSNGFVRYAKIPASEDNGKPLIEIIRGSGVRFNNTRG
ncbi:MAG: hypothetical protein V4699_02065 [Patescibacteria group bacterium]